MMNGKFWPIIITAFFAILIVAFLALGIGSDVLAPVEQTEVPEVSVAEPTATDSPTETAEPTATVTIRPTLTPLPTHTPTPELVDELPKWYFDVVFPQVLEVEPDAELIYAPCQTNEEEVCVVDVNWCPEGKECTHAVLGLHYTFYFEEGKAPDYNMFGPETFLILVNSPWRTNNLLFGEEEYEAYFCLQGWGVDDPLRLREDRFPKFFFPITQEIFEKLSNGYRSAKFGDASLKQMQTCWEN